MLSNAELTILFEALASKDRPLTIVAAGQFPEAHVITFFDLCKATGRKQLVDFGRSFCYGKETEKRANWTQEFKEMACAHFLLKDFDDAFPPSAKRAQMVARQFGRERSRRYELAKKAGRTAMEIAKDIHKIAKKCELHGATLQCLGDHYYRVEIPATLKKETKNHVFTIGPDGILNELPENAGDGVLETRPKVNLE